jgi:hypothetical protein
MFTPLGGASVTQDFVLQNAGPGELANPLAGKNIIFCIFPPCPIASPWLTVAMSGAPATTPLLVTLTGNPTNQPRGTQLGDVLLSHSSPSTLFVKKVRFVVF